MKITSIETYAVGAVWKNWLFVRVHTDAGLYGVGEGTLNGCIGTTEAAIRELEKFVIGDDLRNFNALARKSLGVPVYQFLGGKVRDSTLDYANGWYRIERTPEALARAAPRSRVWDSRQRSRIPSEPPKGLSMRRNCSSPTTFWPPH